MAGWVISKCLLLMRWRCLENLTAMTNQKYLFQIWTRVGFWESAGVSWAHDNFPFSLLGVAHPQQKEWRIETDNSLWKNNKNEHRKMGCNAPVSLKFKWKQSIFVYQVCKDKRNCNSLYWQRAGELWVSDWFCSLVLPLPGNGDWVM